MKKNIIIVLVIVVILLIVGIWFFAGRQKNNGQPANTPVGTNSQNQPNQTANNSNTQSRSNTFAGSLSDLMGKKTPQNCQVSFDQNGTAQTSTLYFDGTNLRMDATSNIGGQPSVTHVLITGGWEYTWNDVAIAGMAANTGIKINMSQIKQQAPATPGAAPNNTGLDIQKSMNFSCTPWTPDASQFVLPANIQFQDLSSLIPSAGSPSGGTPATPASACQACQVIPAGAARTQCESSCASIPSPAK